MGDKKFVEVLGQRMAYVEEGEGRPIVLLHGNPTSSFLWRGVIPALSGLGRCLAPDLIGMGDSDKLEPSGPDRYTFAEHARFLDAWFEALGLEAAASGVGGAPGGIILVVHDWGSALGFHWARRHPGAVAGIAYMEAIVCPLTWADWPDNARNMFGVFRSPAGEEVILEKNLFVEGVLPGAVLKPLAEEVMAEYRRPFAEPGEGRRPTLTWPRQIPIEGDPADVVEVVEAYGQWLAGEDSPPKLFVNAQPGAIVTGRVREFCRTWPNQSEVTVAGVHFVQEDSAAEIGAAVAEWISGLAPAPRDAPVKSEADAVAAAWIARLGGKKGLFRE
jgi:haloalkane dehalogenase